jgi:hypothetical protein
LKKLAGSSTALPSLHLCKASPLQQYQCISASDQAGILAVHYENDSFKSSTKADKRWQHYQEAHFVAKTEHKAKIKADLN